MKVRRDPVPTLVEGCPVPDGRTLLCRPCELHLDRTTCRSPCLPESSLRALSVVELVGLSSRRDVEADLSPGGRLGEKRVTPQRKRFLGRCRQWLVPVSMTTTGSS